MSIHLRSFGLIVLLAGSAVAPAIAQSDDAPRTLEGLWPSDRLLELVLRRWADEAAVKYDLDDEQRQKVTDRTVERWSKFFKENRHEIQPLFNDFIEMRMELQPPSKERVQAWAEQAEPVLDKFRTEIDQGADEFRTQLKPLQRAKFELDALKFGVGLQAAQGKLKQWQKGEFQEHEFWDPPRHERRRRRAEREAAENPSAVEEQPQDQVTLELQGWERYVEEFIRTYDLDEGQTGTARSQLAELKERAVAHRDRNRDRIADLEQRIEQGAGTQEELGEIKKQLVELYGPIDEMFSELKARLDALPTAAQRAKVAEGQQGEESR